MFFKNLPSIASLLLFLALAPTSRAAIYTVTSPYVNGAHTLRVALNQANAHIGMDTIQFDIPLGPLSIPMDSIGFVNIPITDSLRIDGLSQPGTSYPNQLLTYNITEPLPPLTLQCSFLEITGLSFSGAGIQSILYLGSTPVPGIADLRIHHNRLHQLLFFQAGGPQYSTFHVIDFSDNVLDCDVYLMHATAWQSVTVDTLRFHGNTGTSALCGPGGGRCTLAEIVCHYDVTINAIIIDSNSLEYQMPILLQLNDTYLPIEENQVNSVDIGYNTVIGDSTGGYYTVRIISGPGYQDTLQNVYIHDNTFVGNSVGIGLDAYGGFNNIPTMQQVHITRNRLTRQYVNGIFIEMIDTGYGGGILQSVLIDSNEVDACDYAAITIWVEPWPDTRLHDIVLRHNYIHDIAHEGISISDQDVSPNWSSALTGVQFSENRIQNVGWQTIKVNGSGVQLPFLPCRLPTPTMGWVTPQPPYTVHGDLIGPPNRSFRIEFFTNPQAVPETWEYIGADTLQLDATGNGHIAWPAGSAIPRYVTATATDLTTLNTGCVCNAVDTMTVSVPGPATASGLFLYPNPTQSGTVLVNSRTTITHIEVLDPLGRIVHESHPNALNYSLHLPHVGSYVVRMQSEGESRTWTVVRGL